MSRRSWFISHDHDVTLLLSLVIAAFWLRISVIMSTILTEISRSFPHFAMIRPSTSSKGNHNNRDYECSLRMPLSVTLASRNEENCPLLVQLTGAGFAASLLVRLKAGRYTGTIRFEFCTQRLLTFGIILIRSA
jgi:hypothetical protein